MHIEVSPELVELHSKLRNVNYVARKRYGQLLPHSDMARWGSLTDEDRQTRKDLHRHMAVFVPFERALRNFLYAAELRIVKNFFMRAAELNKQAIRVLGLLKSDSVLPSYGSIEFPLYQAQLAQALKSGLSSLEIQQLHKAGGATNKLTGLQVSALCAQAAVIEQQVSAAKLQKLAELLVAELSPAAQELLAWAATRGTRVTQLVRYMKTTERANGV